MATQNSIDSNNPIEIAKGGTANATLASHGVLVADATGAIVSQVGTDGQLLLGATTGQPAFGTVTSNASTITLTPGANSLGLDVTNWVDKTAFTPVLKFGGTSGSSYTTQIGYYLRINNMVFFQIDILLSAKGAATGNCSITGLPLSATAYDFTPCVYYSNLHFTGYVGAQLAASGSTVVLYDIISGSTPTVLTHTAFEDTSKVLVTGCYFV